MLMIAELLFLMGKWYALRQQSVMEYTLTQDDLLYENGEPGFYLDISIPHNYITTPQLTLPNGFYDLEMECEYHGSTSKLEVFRINEGYANKNQMTGSMTLPVSSTEFRVQYGRPLEIHGRLSGDAGEGDYILIRNIRIVSDPALTARYVLFCYAVVFLFTDLLFALAGSRVFKDMWKERRRDIKILVLLTLITSMPAMTGYLFVGHDLLFHLTRIEGIKEEFLNGNFPVRMQTYWMRGYGYPVSIFYGDILLYIPALLRVFGVSVQTAYNFYVLLINFGTVLISYCCFAKMGGRKNGLICTTVFSFNIMRLVDLYTRAAVGEYTAIMFMPLVLYGLWKIYMLPDRGGENSENGTETERGRIWLPLTVGCTGVFLSHILSTEIVAILILAAALLLWKKTFQTKTFLPLCKAALVTFLLCLWFLIPFLDYMMSDKYFITEFSGYTPGYLEGRGGIFGQLFMNEYNVTGTSTGIASGVEKDMPLTVGWASLLALAGWGVLCCGEKRRSKRESREEYLAVFLGVLCIVMSLGNFPYTFLAEKISFTQYLFRSIQYPWRFLAPAGVILAWVLCIVLREKGVGSETKRIFAGALVLIAFWQGVTYMSQLMNEEGAVYFIRTGSVGTMNGGNNEYLLSEGDKNDAEYVKYLNENADKLIYDAGAVEVSDQNREKGIFYMTVFNQTDQTQEVVLPILKYKGYRAFSQSGEELHLAKGERSRISVLLPPFFEGTVQVEFREPWYWRLSEWISLFTFLSLLGYSRGKKLCGKIWNRRGIGKERSLL